MVICTKKYEATHGKKPGGFSQSWHFDVRRGNRVERVKFEAVEFSKATALLRHTARTRLTGATVAEVLG